jgi:hypothetical protein
MTKQEKIEKFLAELGEVKKNNDCIDGFYIICKKCTSQNVVKYDDTAMGSEYTGMYGNAGMKCKDCGNAAEIYS